MTSHGRVLPALALLAIVLLPLAANAQAFVYDWGRSFGGVGDQDGGGIAVDASGNVVIAGSFWNTVDFGGGPLVSAGDWDVFVARLDAAGNHLWSRRFGDAGGQSLRAMSTDALGNIYLTGIFFGTIDFGGGPITSNGGYDVFLAKLDSDGNHVWSRGFGDTGDQLGYGVATDAAGNVFLMGDFTDKLDFGAGALISAGSYDVYLAAFDDSGTNLWSLGFGDAASQRTAGMAVDVAGDVVITGYFQGSMNFGGGVLTSAGGNDVFLAKFSGAGSHLWSWRYGDANYQEGISLATDGDKNILFAGEFAGQVDLGNGPLVSAGGDDIFLAKLDSSGNPIWTRRFGDADSQFPAGLAIGDDGSVAMTGYFDGTIDFGGGTLVCNVTTDVLIAKFDAAGGHVWSASFGDPDYQYGINCAQDPAGSILLTGWYSGGMDLGGGVINSLGGEDIFVARFSSPEPHIQAIVDVPGDQGGWARLHFGRSLGDRVGGAQYPVLNYHVFRRVDNAALAARVERDGSAGVSTAELPAGPGGTPLISFEGRTFWRELAVAAPAVLWEAVATVPARQQNAYIGLVPTLADSGSVNQLSVYFVMAQTTTPWIFYDSAPDSGYSVDNLAPAVPQGLTGAPVVSPGGLQLAWQANAENDLSHYAVYRGTTSGFIPAAGNRVGVPSSPALLDGGWVWNSGFYYKVSAVDVHGNESGYALLSPQQITGVGGDGPPAASFLSQNSPNPFSGSTHIAFGLHEGADVRVRIYDVAGRLVRDLVNAHYAASRHAVTWDGRDDAGREVAGGVYFYRLEAGTFVQTRKLLLMR